MSSKSPRHPIVIIGAGIAGLSAAQHLSEKGIPSLILERFNKSGGRMNSRTGDEWVVDHGCQFVRRSDERLANLIRTVGLEQNRTVIQGGIHSLKADGTIEKLPNGGVDTDRVCIDKGFEYFTEALATQLHVNYRSGVSAIRWDNTDRSFWWEEGQVFWFENDNNEPVRDHDSLKPIMGSGVILATTPTAAAKIAKKSPSLQDLTATLESVEMSKSFTAIYRVAHCKSSFYGLKGEPGSKIGWLAFEDRKAPGRVNYQYSLLVVQAADDFSADLMARSESDAMALLYEEARRIIPELPEKPFSQTYKRWNVSQLKSKPLGYPKEGRWPVNPSQAPFALAGDYLLGNRAEDAAESGVIAAKQIIEQLPARHSFMGIELH